MTGHLAAVPDGQDPDDALDPHSVELTDTSISFVGALGAVTLDKKSSGLIIPIHVDPQSPLSHLDVTQLRFRHLEVTISPVARTASGERVATNPQVDPVKERIRERNKTRQIAKWVDGRLDGPPDPD